MSTPSPATGVPSNFTPTETTFQFTEGDDAELRSWIAHQPSAKAVRESAVAIEPESHLHTKTLTSLTSTDMGLPSDTSSLPMPAGVEKADLASSRSDEKAPVDVALTYHDSKFEAEASAQGISQHIYLDGQDLLLRVTFVERKQVNFVLYIIGSILTAGLLALVAGYWAPQWYRRWCYRAVSAPTEQQLQQGHKIRCSVKIPGEQSEIHTLSCILFDEPVATHKIFPSHFRVPATAHTATRGPLLSTSRAQTSLSSLYVLDYRHTPLLFHAPTRQLVSLADWLDSEIVSSGVTPLGPTELSWRRKLFRDNIIDVKGASVLSLTVREALNPFYIFTFAACGLWGYDDYMVYAIVIGVISILGIAATVWSAKSSQIRLRNLSRYELDTLVWRSSSGGGGGGSNLVAEAQWQTMSSKALVPGDIVNIKGIASEALPADFILLEGTCIANEAMLTGESVPSAKIPAEAKTLSEFMEGKKTLKDMEKSVLWGGTALMRAQADNGSDVIKAMCLSTGWASSKGSLVKMMLFPKPIDFKFYSDAFKFLAILATIAILGFIGSCINFVIVGVDGGEIALRLIDLATIALPPALPAILAICTNFAVSRLKRKSIFCISPKRITVAGKVSIVVSDKTGTLTETGLDVQGVRYPSTAYEGRMCPLAEKVETLEASGYDISMEQAMAVTHDVNMLDGDALGDPLEVSMLAWTGAQLEVQPRSLIGLDTPQRKAQVQCVKLREGGKTFAVLRKFDFAAALRRMSVLVQHAGAQKVTVYVKGAPESMIPLCDPATIPDDFQLVLNDATRKGLRVLAFAYKQVSMSYEGTRTCTRDFAESHLNFLGLLFFENKLKLTTSAVLAELNDAKLQCKMCTGDGVLTAISVARSCGIIPAGQPVYVPRLPDTLNAEKTLSDMSQSAELIWTDVDRPSTEENNEAILDPLTLSPTDSALTLSQVGLAVTGDVWLWLLANAPPETLARLLVQASVFARFDPQSKAELVSRLQAIGHCVLYVGDGSNDCGALQMADVGLSLSEAEASVAAPFTSRSTDIDCVVDLIKEGRNCLAVSSSLFLYVASYALLEYFGVILLYGAITSFDNASYLYQDIFLLFAVAIGAANSRPAARLSTSRPVSRLMSRRVILSFAGAAILLILAELTPYLILHQQDFYVRPTVDEEDLELDNQDSTTVAKTAFFGYTTLALIWNLGPPHREPLYRNYPLCFALITLTAVNLAILWGNDENNGFQLLFGFFPLPAGFRAVIFATAIVQFLLNSLWEFVLISRVSRAIDGPVKSLRRWKQKKVVNRRSRSRKEIEAQKVEDRDFLPPKVEESVSVEKVYQRVERALKSEEEGRKGAAER